MKNKIFIVIFLSLLITSKSFMQLLSEEYKHLGEFYKPKFSSAPFPHPERLNGHVYKGKQYSFQEHYNDSTVAIFIPNGFDFDNEVNFIIYFHGWNNNVDSACAQFNLIEQFSRSSKNAIFIFPEGPKNSPDSFGGRLEEKDGLQKLLYDVLGFLLNKNKIGSKKIGNVVLAGHSGAYRVISFCLAEGGLPEKISDVILFDALYANTEKYLYWVEKFSGRFINIYTDEGGTKSETENMMKKLLDLNIPYFNSEEYDLSLNDLRSNRLIFIHTDLSHNEVISKRNQFENYLRTSTLSEIQK